MTVLLTGITTAVTKCLRRRYLFRLSHLFGCLLALTLVLSPAPAQASLTTTRLTNAISNATGILRELDPRLAELAQQRSSAIVALFSHEGKPEGAAEIIMWWTHDGSDVVEHGIAGWLASPPHAAVMNNPIYTKIGCGHTSTLLGNYLACLFAIGSGEYQQPVVALANTAIRERHWIGWLMILTAGLWAHLILRHRRDMERNE